MPRERGEIMINYYLNLNAQSSGEHEVHKESCYYYYMYKSGYNFESRVLELFFQKKRHLPLNHKVMRRFFFPQQVHLNISI